MSRNVPSLLVLLLLTASLFTQAQQEPSSSSQDSGSAKSLAEIAKKSKDAKAKDSHARKVITDDDLSSLHGPLPSLDLSDNDNSDEIVEAIGAYRKTHTAEETEQAVHQWYDEYDSTLLTAIRESNRTRDRRNDTIYNGYWGCQDSPNYQTCIVRRRAETRGLHDDQSSMRSDGVTVGHIQQAFQRIRSGIMRYGLHYEWFKVRNANGIGSF